MNSSQRGDALTRNRAADGRARGTCDAIGGARIEDVPTRNWLFSVNVHGVLHGIRHFLPLIRHHSEGGHIVNTSSAIGLFVAPDIGLGPCSATKYALIAISEALEQDLAGTNIGISVLCPGAVDTRILDAGHNRPAHFGGAYARARDEGLTAALAAGMSVDAVGEPLLRGIRDGEMYILTDEVAKPAIEARFLRVLDAFAGVGTR